MPVVKVKGLLIYFSHVPKAAGSSVETYLTRRGGVLALRDTRWGKQSLSKRWTATSPQHVDAVQFARLFPEEFFDHVFMVVRHPEDRILSEYRFRTERGRRDARAPFSEWLRYAMSAARRDPYMMDGHVRPQMDFRCGAACRVFRLEDGLGDFVAWLDATLGEAGEAFGVRSNVTKPVEVTMRREDRALIEAFYAEDYDAFGYARRPLDDLLPLVPLRRATCAAISLAGRLPIRR